MEKTPETLEREGTQKSAQIVSKKKRWWAPSSPSLEREVTYDREIGSKGGFPFDRVEKTR